MDDERLSSGEFAARTRLSRKALRVYERAGLLCPADVDPSTGYRRYGSDQVRIGRLIALLRGADLGLADIDRVLADLAAAPAAAVARLEQLHADAGRRHADRMLVIRHVQSILAPGGDPMFPIRTRQVPATRVMSIQRRLHAPETDGFVREAKAAFARRLAGAEPTGPFTLIFHGVVDHDSDGPLEATLGCPDDVGPGDVVGIRIEPAHEEAYATITKAQWAYPAILAAYDAVASSAEVSGRSRARLSCREVYLAEPDDLGDDELICDIAFPLGDRP